MTKEEIEQNDLLYYINEGKNQDEVTGFIDGWKKGYSRADQQTTEKNSEIERLKAELNELKEKHKRDIESSFRDGLFRPKLYMNNAELYYKQKFESND